MYNVKNKSVREIISQSSQQSLIKGEILIYDYFQLFLFDTRPSGSWSSSSLPDGGVGGRVDVDLDLGPAGPVADPAAHLAGPALGVGQVVEPGQGVGQQAHVGTAEAEAPSLGPPLGRAGSPGPRRPLLRLVFVRPSGRRGSSGVIHQGVSLKHLISPYNSLIQDHSSSKHTSCTVVVVFLYQHKLLISSG